MIQNFLILLFAFSIKAQPLILNIGDVLDGRFDQHLMSLHYPSIRTSPLVLGIKNSPQKYNKLLESALQLVDQVVAMTSASQLKILPTDHPTTEYLVRGTLGFAIGITAFNEAFKDSPFFYQIFEIYFKKITRSEQLRAGALVLSYRGEMDSPYLDQLIQKQNWTLSIARLSSKIHQHGRHGSFRFGAFLDAMNSNISLPRRCGLILSGWFRPL